MCTESLLSLTSHWIDGSWKRKSAILHTSHPTANIKEKFLKMMDNWNLDGKVGLLFFKISYWYFVMFSRDSYFYSYLLNYLLTRA